MLKAIHAQESREAAQERAAAVIAELRRKKLTRAAELVEDSIGETLPLLCFPGQPLNQDPDQQPAGTHHEGDPPPHADGRRVPGWASCLSLAAAKLRHIAGSQCWDEGDEAIFKQGNDVEIASYGRRLAKREVHLVGVDGAFDPARFIVENVDADAGYRLENVSIAIGRMLDVDVGTQPIVIRPACKLTASWSSLIGASGIGDNLLGAA